MNGIKTLRKVLIIFIPFDLREYLTVAGALHIYSQLLEYVYEGDQKKILCEILEPFYFCLSVHT